MHKIFRRVYIIICFMRLTSWRFRRRLCQLIIIAEMIMRRWGLITSDFAYRTVYTYMYTNNKRNANCRVYGRDRERKRGNDQIRDSGSDSKDRFVAFQRE